MEANHVSVIEPKDPGQSPCTFLGGFLALKKGQGEFKEFTWTIIKYVYRLKDICTTFH